MSTGCQECHPKGPQKDSTPGSVFLWKAEEGHLQTEEKQSWRHLGMSLGLSQVGGTGEGHHVEREGGIFPQFTKPENCRAGPGLT